MNNSLDHNPEIGKTVIAAGLATNYLESGTGEPLILIHGSGPGVTAFANWRPLLPALSEHYRVLAPDVAGFGYTARKARTTYNLDFWLHHLTEWLASVGVSRARFIGNSFGGALTLALASRRPDLVERFVLMGAAGVPFELTPGLAAVWGYTPSESGMRQLIETFAYKTDFLTEALVRSRYEASIRPGYQETFSKMFEAPFQRHIDALATPDNLIRRIQQRALVIHGRDDKIIPLTNSVRLHQLLEHSDLHVFGECGHWAQLERTQPFLKLVLDFLTSP